MVPDALWKEYLRWWIHRPSKSNYAFYIWLLTWIIEAHLREKRLDEMIKMEKEEKEEEFHKIIPIFLNRNDKNKE